MNIALKTLGFGVLALVGLLAYLSVFIFKLWGVLYIALGLTAVMMVVMVALTTGGAVRKS